METMNQQPVIMRTSSHSFTFNGSLPAPVKIANKQKDAQKLNIRIISGSNNVIFDKSSDTKKRKLEEENTQIKKKKVPQKMDNDMLEMFNKYEKLEKFFEKKEEKEETQGVQFTPNIFKQGIVDETKPGYDEYYGLNEDYDSIMNENLEDIEMYKCAIDEYERSRYECEKRGEQFGYTGDYYNKRDEDYDEMEWDYPDSDDALF